jgi:hypothetical protein
VVLAMCGQFRRALAQGLLRLGVVSATAPVLVFPKLPTTSACGLPKGSGRKRLSTPALDHASLTSRVWFLSPRWQSALTLCGFAAADHMVGGLTRCHRGPGRSLAAFRHDKMVAPMVFNGAMTGTYVERCLVRYRGDR